MSVQDDLAPRTEYEVETSTYAPVHKVGCEVCKAYRVHVRDDSIAGSALRGYYSKRAEMIQAAHDDDPTLPCALTNPRFW